MYNAAADSFPSSHTAFYWGLLLPAAACLPRYRIPLLVLPVLISIGRIIENVHYISDVLAAIALVGLIANPSCGV
jgi:membrane-associated phospholipid phosphatase